MRGVVTLTRADLRSRWQGWLTAALVIAVAGAVVLTTATGARRTETAYARFLRSSRGADVELAVSGPGGRQNLGGVSRFYAAVARLPGVDVVAPTVGVSAAAPARGNTGILLKAGVDARLGRAIERPKITQGRMFDPARADEVVADRPLATHLHLHVGSMLELLAGPSGPAGVDPARATPLTVRVVGIAVTRDNVIPVTALAAQESLLVPPALLRGLGPDAYAFDAAFVRLHNGVSVASFRRAVQPLVRRHPETGGQLFVVDEHQQAAKIEQAIKPQAVALALFALLVTLTSVLIIGQVLVRQVFDASGDHRTSWALGLTRAQLRAVTFAEVGVTVTTGAALAVLMAAALSPLMPIGPARVAEPHPGVAVNWLMVAGGALVIVLVFVLRIARPVWRQTAESTRPEGAASGREVEGPSRLLELLLRTGAPASAAVGARLALESGTGRTAVPVRSTLAGAAVAVAAVAAAFTFGTNLVRLVNTPRLYGQTWQVSVDAEFGTISRPDGETFLRQQPGVARWTFGNHVEATVAGRPVATIELADGDGPLMFPTVIEGRAPRAPDEILLGSNTLADTRRRVGQTVMVALQSESAARTMRVVGRAVFPFFGQGEVSPTGLGDGAAVLHPGPPPDGFNFVLVSMEHGRAEHDRVARFARQLDATSLCPEQCRAVTAQRPADVNNYARITATPLALAALLSLFAVATVADLLVTSIRRRRHDLAVLKAVGFLRQQLSAAVAWEASIVVTLAVLVGLPVGVAAGRSAWLFFGDRLGVVPDPQVPLLPVLLSFPAALAIANAVAVVPGWLAGRVRPATVLRAG